jgi:hypothetical protein
LEPIGLDKKVSRVVGNSIIFSLVDIFSYENEYKRYARVIFVAGVANNTIKMAR